VGGVVGEIRAWVARKEKDPLKGFFFKGESWTAPAPAWARVETRAFSDDGATSEMWAVRYEHVDGDVKSRRWSTNIGVTQVGPQEWRIAVQLTHRLRPGFVGREPLAPQPSSPRLVTGLRDSRNWLARADLTWTESKETTRQSAHGQAKAGPRRTGAGYHSARQVGQYCAATASGAFLCGP